MMLDSKAMQRRCGGGWSVPEVDLAVTNGGNYDGAEVDVCAGATDDVVSVELNAAQADEKREEEEAAAAGEMAGEKLWEEWAMKLRLAKKAQSRLRSAGGGVSAVAKGPPVCNQDIPVSIAVLTLEPPRPFAAEEPP